MFSLTVSLILLSRAFWYWHRAWYWGGATISPWKPFLARFQMISPIICCDVQGRVTFLFKCNCMWYTQIQWYQRSCRHGNQKMLTLWKLGNNRINSPSTKIQLNVKMISIFACDSPVTLNAVEAHFIWTRFAEPVPAWNQHYTFRSQRTFGTFRIRPSHNLIVRRLLL